MEELEEPSSAGQSAGDRGEPSGVGAAYAATLAAELALQKPDLAADAQAFLQAQKMLADAQRERVEAEHHFFETVEKSAKRLMLRAQMVLRLLSVGGGILLLGGLITLIVSASRSHRVIFDSVDVAANVAGEVPDGKILAGMLRDEIATIQARTRGSGEELKPDLSNAWANEVSVEIPESNLSIAQLRAFLQETLGHNVYLGGDVTRYGPKGLRLTVRGTGIIAKGFDINAANPEEGVHQAAEYLFGEAETRLFADYLYYQQRYADDVAFSREHVGRVSRNDAASLRDDWASSLQYLEWIKAGDEIERLEQMTIREVPNFWFAYEDLEAFYMSSGQEAKGQATCQQHRQAIGHVPTAQESRHLTACLLMEHDFLGYVSAVTADASSDGGTLTYANQGLLYAYGYVRAHDPQRAEELVATTNWSREDPLDQAHAEDTLARIEEEQGAWTQAAQHWQAYLAATADRTVAIIVLSHRCEAAPDLERAGLHAQADEALKADEAVLGVGTFANCAIAAGEVAILRGNLSAAEAHFKRSIGLAPALPHGYEALGRLQWKRGETAQAETSFRLAIERGPAWADPLKGLGDVLWAQGRRKEAIAAYEAALKHAPHWQSLIEARAALEKAR